MVVADEIVVVFLKILRIMSHDENDYVDDVVFDDDDLGSFEEQNLLLDHYLLYEHLINVYLQLLSLQLLNLLVY